MRRWIALCGVSVAMVVAARAAEPLETARERLKREVMSSVAASPALKDLIVQKLLPHSTNPVLVGAVRARNALKVPLKTVQSLDQEWIVSVSSLTALKKSTLENASAAELRRIVAELPALRECFVMDDQGATVGETNLTSDYWQGDEKKWVDSYNGGKGAAHVAFAEFDASANAVLQQVTLPIMDGEGRAIGAVMWGVSLKDVPKSGDGKPVK